MFTNIIFDESEVKLNQITNFFKKEHKIKYNRKLSGKIRLYISDKNAIKDLGGLLSLYKRDLH